MLDSPNPALQHEPSLLPSLNLLQVQLDIDTLRGVLEEDGEAAAAAQLQPARARQAADAAVARLRALREEEAEVAARLREVEYAEAAVEQVGSEGGRWVGRAGRRQQARDGSRCLP